MKLVWVSLCLWLAHGGGIALVTAATACGPERELNQTPTWAVAGVCAVIVIISILLEKLLHKLGSWFTERHKRALFEALEKVKAELMVLGFISLLLTFGQNYFLKICVSEDVANSMLPCPYEGEHKTDTEEEHRRRLLWFEHRMLAGADSATKCKEGHVPLISANGLHQLHILIFFLAVFHVIYSFVTMMLGRLKIRGWKEWEQETSSHDYEFSNDPSRFRLTHETSFVRAHTSFWTKIPVFFYFGCFCRQFFRSVSKSDYMTLRNGFISVHLAPGSKFNFQKYIKRSLEDDFKLVVGVSPVLWASFVVFLLVNVNGWRALFWASIIPVIIILAVGTELQSILTKMAIDISDRHAVVQGIPLVQGSDKYFWFGRPQLVLHLIHFALFQNAFQITYFLWIWYAFGMKSCFHANFTLAIVKVSIGVGVLLLCSYITLPLHALVTQMGSNMKKAVFDEHTSKALKKWHMAVKKKKAAGRGSKSSLSVRTLTLLSTGSSGHTLHRFKTTGHSTRAYYAYRDDDELSDMETEALSPAPSSSIVQMSLIEGTKRDHEDRAGEESSNGNEEDFSFVKPAVSFKQP
ncbi:unnamed protein product [Linum tenue]|uniref:MLO-like protein n=1 Tax=Linum tenue TaxID=586396 RepID=A0AAV0KLU0_9ROSI|nr:unnamed protein product [Linum tenue]